MKTCDHCGTPAKRRYAVRITKGGHIKVAMVGSSCAKRFPRANQSDLIRSLYKSESTESEAYFHGSNEQHMIGTVLKKTHVESVLGYPRPGRSGVFTEYAGTFVEKAFEQPSGGGITRVNAMFFADNVECLGRHGASTQYIYRVEPIGKCKRVNFGWFLYAMNKLDSIQGSYSWLTDEQRARWDNEDFASFVRKEVDSYYQGEAYPGWLPIPSECLWEYISEGIKITGIVKEHGRS